MITFFKRFVSQYRRTPLARTIADSSRRYTRWVENYNYDITTNGERTLLSKLRGKDIRTVFDVGANIGDWTVIARENFPEARIHCFEVVPDTAAELAQRLQNDPNILVNSFGLADTDRAASVKYYPEAPALSSLIDFPHPRQARFVPGKVRSGDGYLREHTVHHVDFLKIDVEGSEAAVFGGFKQALQERRISIIQFEYGTPNILAKFLLYDAYAVLMQRGYVLGKIYPRGVEFRSYSFQDEDFLLSNYLAVLENRTDLIQLLR